MRLSSLLRLTSLIATLLAAGIALCAQTEQDHAPLITAAPRNRELDRAMDLIESAIHNYPNNPQFRMFEGLAHAGKGDQEGALASYKAALKISPNYVPALKGAAQIDYDARRREGSPEHGSINQLRGDRDESSIVLDWHRDDRCGAEAAA
jgi:tetratricopeptide (TPR) repeat protein